MANQIVVSAGAKVRNLSGVLTATSGVVSFLPIDVSLGIPQLDVNGKILVSQLPNSVMEYKGTWSAATNTPTLANGTGNQGDVYLCNVAGTVDFGAGPIAFFVGDQVIYSGSIWQRASGATGTVTSVAVTESGDSLNITGSPITTSGTINIGFNGTNLQYVNGAGNLTTFPILTGYVTAVSGTAPVVSSGGTTPAISMAAATGSVDGYLSATDFAIFSAKQSALTFSSPLVNTSGTISIPAATTSVNGYLASADFTTFNNKQNTITLTTTGTSGASTLVGATLNIPNYGSALTGYVPYTGATANVDLGVYDLTADLITGARGSFASNGGSDTFAINHSSGGGIALNITKGGNGEGLYINKTSGSGNAATIIGTLNATTLVKSGGTSSQFLKADGTVDSNTYALDSAVVHLAGTETITGAKTFSGYTTFTSTVDITSGLTFSNSGFTLLLQPPTLSVNRTVTFADITGTIAMLEGTQTFTGYKTFDAALELKYNVIPTPSSAGNIGIGSNGVGITITTKPVSTVYNNNLYFASASNTFTFPNATGTIALTSDLANYVDLTTAQTIGGTKTFTSFTKNDFGVLLNASGNYTAASGYNGFGGTSNGIRVVMGQTAIHDLVFSALANYTYTFPSATGTIALVGGSGVGTVTSVAALTLGTTGTDLSSTVATSTTTPVITLNVPTASATNRGALSSADWTTFNNKQSALTNPVLASGTWTSGYLPKINGTYTIGNSLVYDTGTNVLINQGATDNGKGARLQITQSGNNTNGIDLKNTDATYGHIGTFGNNLYLTQNYYYSSGQNYDSATFGQAAINLAAGTTNTSTISFALSDAGATSPSTKMTLNSSGNLGLGVTPSAWSTSFGIKVIDLGSKGSVYASDNDANLSFNQYFDGTNAVYKTTGTASRFALTGNEFTWRTAPSGTAGNAITFTQAMTLTASGRLLLNTTSDNGARLQVNGDITTGDASTISSVSNFLIVRAATNLILDGNTGSVNIRTNNADKLVIANSGAATFSSSVTATQGFFNGFATNGTPSSAGTAQNFVEFRNTGGDFYIGQEGSVAGNFFTGSSAYASVFYGSTAQEFIIGGVRRLQIASSGAATFSSTLGINGVSNNVTSGTYTPTASVVVNCSAVSAYNGKYIRVGNIVYVSMDATATFSSTTAAFYVSIPVGGVFSGGPYSGQGFAISTAGAVVANGPVYPEYNTTNVQCNIYVDYPSATTLNFVITFQYLVE